MGTNAIFSVLAFIIVFTIVDMSMNKSNLRTYENTYGYVKYKTAREIARNSIQITLRKIDTTSVLTSGDFPVTGNSDGGTFNVAGTIIGTDSLKLVATSVFSDTTYTIRTTLFRKKIPLPPSLYKGAFGIYPDSTDFSYNSNKDSINGRDHDVYGDLIPGSTDTVPPVEVRTVTDSGLVYNAVDSKGSLGTLVGTPKIWVDPAISNPNTSSDAFAQIADTIKTQPGNGTKQIGDFGTFANPIIVFCDGTDPSTGLTTGTFALNGDNWGILVVKGNLTLKGNSTWHGAIIQYGNIKLSFSAGTGNSQIYGGMIYGGLNGGKYEIKGNLKIKHSKAALNLRDKIKDPFIYEIVDWYE